MMTRTKTNPRQMQHRVVHALDGHRLHEALAGARDVQARFVERSWDGAERTMLKLTWEPPS